MDQHGTTEIENLRAKNMQKILALWAVPSATGAGIATTAAAAVLLHASSHLGHQLVTAQAANRLVSTEQANALPSVVPRLMTLSPFETMTSCMVP